MQTLKVELTSDNSLKALQELECQHLIRIVTEPDPNSYSLPGHPVSDEEFRKWIEQSENSPEISLTEAKKQWIEQKKKLKKFIR
jgi:poly(3-hydroxyalkanoate) synthetase